MRKIAAGYILVVLALMLMVNAVGCSHGSQPTDAEVLRAIEESGILRSVTFKVTSPVEIVERGEKKPDGSWPVKVKMTLVMQLPDGRVSEPKENTTTFRIFSSDASGRKVWKAALGY